MRGLFNLDGPIYRFMEKVANGMILSVLWTLFSLPVITVGASTTAMYYTVQKVVCSETGHIWSTFWTAFKDNLKQATAMWIIWLLICALLGLDCYFAYILSDVNSVLNWMTVFIIVLLSFVIMWSIYWFPYISHIDDPIRSVLKNTFIICITNFGRSLSLLVGFVICMVIMVYLPFSPIFLLILPAGYMYFAALTLKKVFGQYWNMEEEIINNND